MFAKPKASSFFLTESGLPVAVHKIRASFGTSSIFKTSFLRDLCTRVKSSIIPSTVMTFKTLFVSLLIPKMYFLVCEECRKSATSSFSVVLM